MIDKIDLENNLNRVHEWIRAADQKVSIFLAFQGVVITFLFPKLLSWSPRSLGSISWASILALLAGLIFLLYGLIKSVCALIPRLKKKTKGESFIYFGDIAEMNFGYFKKGLAKLDGKDYENELIKQIYISAKIAKTKHQQFGDSIISFLLGLAILGFVFISLTTTRWYGN